MAGKLTVSSNNLAVLVNNRFKGLDHNITASPLILAACPKGGQVVVADRGPDKLLHKSHQKLCASIGDIIGAGRRPDLRFDRRPLILPDVIDILRTACFPAALLDKRHSLFYHG